MRTLFENTEHQFLVGDAIEQLRTLPDQCVHTVITSPPYWGFRQYGAATGELGREATPLEYTEHLVEAFREVRRVMRDDGTLWVNIGDAYNNPGANRHSKSTVIGTTKLNDQPATRKWNKLKRKDLIGIPWRLAFALQDDGWYLRQDCVWYKPNPLPSTARDRLVSAHEYVFLLSKKEYCYFDKEAIREPAAQPKRRRTDRFGGVKHNKTKHSDGSVFTGGATRDRHDVWIITTKPFAGAHCAAFPPDLPEIPIKAGTSEHGCCPKCGAPYKRIVRKGEPDREWQAACGGDAEGEYKGAARKDYALVGAQDASAIKKRILAGMRKRITVGWEPTCSCDAGEPVPCTVLDPFGGAGTTSYVARRLGRSSIYIDLYEEYAQMARERVYGMM